MKYLLIFFLFLFVSCYRNETCKTLFIGEFKIDTDIIRNPKCLEYVRQYSWDTVKLISKESGKYFFQTDDVSLNECEGEWWINSANVDGDCIGYIKQNNLKGNVSKPPFYIVIKIGGESYTLPFRKIDSVGDFVLSSGIQKRKAFD